ncbi:MAG: polymer-forming cytoskeletal protein [Bacillota bacterium]|nr:polymer-forming cytoskeletal protein [Bacillota bacterium]
MFEKIGNINKASNNYEVIIGEHTKFEGDITAEGNVKIDGKLNGDIKSNGEVFIGETSIITGNITSNSTLTISGKVTGKIKANGDLKITETGNLKGDILVSSFIINKGGTFKGNCSINTEEAKLDLSNLSIEFDKIEKANIKEDKKDEKINKKSY